MGIIFVDLEANCDGSEIISIGCVKADTNETFYTLIKPQDLTKITPIITKLTHIAPSDMVCAPNLDEAMRDFLWFVGDIPDVKFVFYGDSDKLFLSSNLELAKKHISKSALRLMIDYYADFQSSVKAYYKLPTSIKLIKVFNHLNNSSVEQCHNALEDATMLKFVAENMLKDKWEVNPFGDYLDKMPDDAKEVVLTDTHTKQQYHFPSIGEAARYIAQLEDTEASSKNIRTYLRRTAKGGAPYHGFKCKIIEKKQENS